MLPVSTAWMMNDLRFTILLMMFSLIPNFFDAVAIAPLCPLKLSTYLINSYFDSLVYDVELVHLISLFDSVDASDSRTRVIGSFDKCE